MWEAQAFSTAYTRAGSVPFTIGQSRVSDLFGRQAQFSDTLSWSRGKHTVRLGTSVIRHTSGGTGNEPGFATLGTFTFLNTTTAPFDQLTLADVQQYTQPISYGVTSYELNQWLITGYAQDSFHVNDDLTLDLGLRYDRQTLTDAKKNFAPRVGFGWHPTAIRGSRSAAASGCTTRRSAPTRSRDRSPAASTATPPTARRRASWDSRAASPGRACRCNSIRRRCRRRSCRRATSRFAPAKRTSIARSLPAMASTSI